MALHWELGKIKNWRELTTHPDDRKYLVEPDAEDKRKVRWNPVTNALLYVTMAVDMGSITEKNWKEFYARVYAYERIRGAMMQRVDEKDEIVNVYITAKDIHDHIGLTTNVSTKTKQQWAKRLVEIAEDEVRHHFTDIT